MSPVSLRDVSDVGWVEVLSGESLEYGPVVGQGADGLGGCLAVESPPQEGDSHGMGEVLDGDALPVEIAGNGPVAA